MLRIVLDSTVFCEDFHLSKGDAAQLRRAAEEGRIAVHVSQVVIDEVKRRYVEGVRDDGNTLLSKLRPFVSGRFGRVVTSDIDADLKLARESYPAVLDGLIALPGFVVEPYPDVSHAVLVERDLQRRLPFRASRARSSTGYRDVLIWLTVLDLAERYEDDEVLFVTNNSDDYTDTKARPESKRGSS
jgi:hypothetical protein